MQNVKKSLLFIRRPYGIDGSVVVWAQLQQRNTTQIKIAARNALFMINFYTIVEQIHWKTLYPTIASLMQSTM